MNPTTRTTVPTGSTASAPTSGAERSLRRVLALDAASCAVLGGRRRAQRRVGARESGARVGHVDHAERLGVAVDVAQAVAVLGLAAAETVGLRRLVRSGRPSPNLAR
jgi:hypothetical protein